MDFSSLSPHLKKIAEVANSVIKQRYGLQNGIVNTPLSAGKITVPFTPTLHWKTPKEFIICEVADNPLPTAVKVQYTDIAATGLPIRIIVAYPHDHGLTGSEYVSQQKNLKALGIGFFPVNDSHNTNIEYQGVCVNQKIDAVDLKKFPSNIKRAIQEAHECYMQDGKPDVGLQKLGQLAETLVYNAAFDAKKKGSFKYAKFKPPKFIGHKELLDNLKSENILGLGLLDRCQDFANARNAVSHTPKTIPDSIKVSKSIRDNFILGLRLIEDIIGELKLKKFSVKP